MSVSCTRKEALDRVGVIYSSKANLSELTKIVFPEMQFIEGVDNSFVNRNNKEYKLVFSHTENKKKVVEKNESVL